MLAILPTLEALYQDFYLGSCYFHALNLGGWSITKCRNIQTCTCEIQILVICIGVTTSCWICDRICIHMMKMEMVIDQRKLCLRLHLQQIPPDVVPIKAEPDPHKEETCPYG